MATELAARDLSDVLDVARLGSAGLDRPGWSLLADGASAMAGLLPIAHALYKEALMRIEAEHEIPEPGPAFGSPFSMFESAFGRPSLIAREPSSPRAPVDPLSPDVPPHAFVPVERFPAGVEPGCATCRQVETHLIHLPELRSDEAKA